MSIQVALHHRTTYRYDKPVALGPQVVRLRPAPHSRTSVLSYSLTVEPKQHFINWQQDPQGNHLARLVFPEKTDIFEVVVDLVADMTVINPFDFFLEPAAEQWPFAYDASLAEEIAPFRKVKPAGPLLSAWLAKVDPNPQRTIDFIVGLNARLQQEIGYIVRLEPGVQDCEETLSLAKGSCRDTGWLLVTIMRHLGFAARFASGYLIQLMPDEKPLEGPEGPTTTSPTSMPGARSICRAQDGSDSIRHRACSPAKAISRSPARPSRRAPRRSRARSRKPR